MISFGWPTIVSALRLLRAQPARPLLRQALPRRGRDRPLRRRVPLQPDRARRGLRLPHGLAAVALLVAEHGPPPGDGRPRRRWFFGAIGLPRRPRLRLDPPDLPPAHARGATGRRREAVAPLSLAAMATGAYAVTAVGLNVTKRMRLISADRRRRRGRRGRPLLPPHPAVRLRRSRLGDRGRALVDGPLRRDRLAADLPGAVGLAAARPGRRPPLALALLASLAVDAGRPSTASSGRARRDHRSPTRSCSSPPATSRRETSRR